jgi:hypothetical protein
LVAFLVCAEDVTVDSGPAADRGPDHPRRLVGSRLTVREGAVLPSGTAWGSASIQARNELARRLDATAVILTAGRDLLNTHLARDPGGARQFRSEWALVSCSPSARQALLAELATLARQITPSCTGLALSAAAPGTADARRGLQRACGWLQVFSACVQNAQRTGPVTAADRDLLHAIPLNDRLLRPVLDGTEPVTQLYDAVIASADRARHAAWETSSQPAWSPHLTADSLRQAAATTTVTSHGPGVFLR